MSKPTEEVVWSTSDFSIAAYLHSLGVRLVNVTYRQGGQRQDAVFHFDNRSGRCPEMAIRFLNSDAFNFDQGQRALKKLVFGWPGQEEAGERGSWSTTDFPLASYILSSGAEFVGFRRIHRSRREYEFYFSDGDGACEELSVAFVNSAAHRFDQSQRALKKLVFGR